MTSLYLAASLRCIRNYTPFRRFIINNLNIPPRSTAAQKHTSCPTPPAASVLQGDGERRHEVNFNVNRFGLLRTRTGADCHLFVEPVDPELCPDQNIARVVHGLSSTVGGSSQISDQLKVEYKDNCLSIYSNDTSRRSIPPSEDLIITVPIKFDIDADVSGTSNVSIKGIQNESVQIKTEKGSCSLNNIKCDDVSVRTAGGSIVCEGMLHGNATFQTTGDGYVTINRPLCQLLNIQTECGDVTVDSLYAERSKFVVKSGDIRIKNAHRSVGIEITDSGNISIDTLDGSLHAATTRGNISVYVCRHNSVNIAVESGDVLIKVPATLDSTLDITGSSVTLDGKLDQSNLESCSSQGQQTVSGFVTLAGDGKPAELPSIKAHTKQGTIQLVCQDWLSSLNLGNFEET